MEHNDLTEKGSHPAKGEGNVQVSTETGLYDPSLESCWTRWGLSLDSYTRAPGSTGGLKTAGTRTEADGLKTDSNTLLQQKMKPRHLQMIAVGGSIGTGLFVATGQALRTGGPGGVLIAWTLIGMMLINVTQALGELCILYPVSGGFFTLAVRFLDSGFGMALGWNYLILWFVVLPLEITVAGITVQYWQAAASVPIAVWITVFWIAIIIINIFPLGYAEEEFWSSCLKLVRYIGGEYWRDPGAFANGFKGVCAVFVTAAFSFAGTELVGLAATETPNPRATMPGAVKNTFWRITVVYLSTLLIVGLNVPYNDSRLLDTSGGTGTSPFVLMVETAGIRGLGDFLNIVICISCVYAGSRVLLALAEQGFAPKMFTYIDKSGRPLYAVIAILLAVDWLLAISGLSTLFTWGSICACHIRFRGAWKVQGHSVDELPFKAMFGVYGSWFGVILVGLVLVAQFFIAVWPIGGRNPDGGLAAQAFFKSYLAAPVLLGLWVSSLPSPEKNQELMPTAQLAAFIWKRSWPHKLADIDLDTGRKSWLTVDEMKQWRAGRAAAPMHIRVYRMLFSN
ncbi:hypothetical protein RQP46_007528 [Phenoliferia psychrophenolica]